MKLLYLPLVLGSLTWAADAVYVPPYPEITITPTSRTSTKSPPPIPTDLPIAPDIIDPLPFPKCGSLDAPGCGAGESCIENPGCAPGSQCRGLCVPFGPTKPDPNAPMPTPMFSLIGTDFSDPPPLPPNCGPIDAPGCGAGETCIDDPKCPPGRKCRGTCIPIDLTEANPNPPQTDPIDYSLIGTDFSQPPPLPPNCGPIDAPGCGQSETCVDDPKCPKGSKCRGICVPYVPTTA